MGRSKGGGKGNSKGQKKSRNVERPSSIDDNAILNDSVIEDDSQNEYNTRSTSQKRGKKTPKKGKSVHIAGGCGAAARFEEDGNVVDMTAEGMETEYLNEDDDTESDEEQSMNNNATLGNRHYSRRTRREDGERSSSERENSSQVLDRSADDSCPDLTEGEMEDSAATGARPKQMNAANRKGVATTTKRKQAATSDDLTSIASLREELDTVNQTFVKLQRLMERGGYRC